MNEESYQGWTNYETWCVVLWIDNEQPSYEYWRAMARRHKREAPTSEGVRSRIWTAEQAARLNLADQLRGEVTDCAPISEATLYTDLLTAALEEVNWREIAENLLEEVEGTQE